MTKISEATTTLTAVSASLGTYLLPLGKTGVVTSVNMLISELETYINDSLNKIEQGDSHIEVIDIGTGAITIRVDGTDRIKFLAGSFYPNVNDDLDLGTTTNKFKDLHLAGGIELGSDSTGDIYYRDGSGNLERLGKGTVGQVLIQTSTIPAWTDYIRSDDETLVAATPLAVSFSSDLGTVDANVVVQCHALDAANIQVPVELSSVTKSGFTAETTVNSTLYYTANLKI